MNKALHPLRFSIVVLLFALFFYFPVSSFHCDSGSLETTCTLSQPQTSITAQSISGSGNLVLESTADLNTNAKDFGIAMGGFIENRGDINAALAGWQSISGNWLYRKTLTFNNSAQTANLTDFPALVTLTPADFNYSRAQSNGADIRFTDSDGSTLLNYEIEDWNADGNSHVWVRVPQINASSSTDFIYLYYGNASASDDQNAAGVWDSNYKMVQHLDYDSSQAESHSVSLRDNGYPASLFVAAHAADGMWCTACGGNIYTYGAEAIGSSGTPANVDITGLDPNKVYIISIGITLPAGKEIYVKYGSESFELYTGALVYTSPTVLGTTTGVTSVTVSWYTTSAGGGDTHMSSAYAKSYPLTDSTSNANNATKKAAGEPASTAAGKIDSAEVFDGTDDYVSVSNPSSFNMNGKNYSIEAWVKPNNTNIMAIFSKWWDGTTRGYNLAIDGGTIRFETGESGGITHYTPSCIVTGIWQEISVVYDGTDYKFYHDGNLVDTWSTSFSVYDNSAEVKIGDYSHTSLHQYFNGSIDEVHISSTARDSNWIAASYLVGLDQFVSKGSEESGAWDLDNWAYRKPISIDNTDNPEALTDYQVLVEVPYNSNMDIDFDDLRFIDPSTGSELSYWVESGYSRSCYDILQKNPSATDGYYSIKPNGTTSVQVYCDMANGGWTRLNNNVATSTTSFNSSDVLITNNVDGACGTPGSAFTISNISVDHTDVKIHLTRTTSIVQCAGLVGVGSASSTYWSGSAWVSNAMCLWSDGIFANATSTDMTGLKLLWKIEGTKASNGEIKLKSECSSSDTGQIQVTAWVKGATSSSTDANVWIKVPSIPAHSAKAVHLYYSNSSATSNSNGSNVFDFFDDFESGTTNKWTKEGSAEFVASSTVSKTGVYSGRYKSTADWAKAYMPVGTQSGTFIAEMDSYQVSAPTYRNYMRFDEGTTAGAAPAFDSTGQIVYYDGSLHDLQAYSYSTWYQWKYVVKTATDKFDLAIDGIDRLTDGGYQSAVTNLDKFTLAGGANGGYLYIDNFRVRKYATTEPSTALLAEETPSTQSSATVRFKTGTAEPFTDIGLVADWNFNEGSGQLQYDAVGSNDGNYKGSSLSFDGNNDYVSMPDSASLTFSGAMSMEVWVYQKAQSGGEDKILFNERGYQISFAGNTFAGALYGASGWKTVQSSTKGIDQWYHVVLTNNPSGNLSLYVNGELEDTNSGYSITGTGGGYGLYIGNWKTAGQGYDYNGLIDEVRIYHRTLSLAEVREHYHGVFSSEADLVGLWHLDEATGTAVGDDSGNANNGTLTGATWSTESPAIWRESSVKIPGQSGSALYFNGLDNYVDVSDVNYDWSAGFSVCAWAYFNSFKSWSRIIDFGQGQDNDNIIFANEQTGDDLAWSVRINGTTEARIDADDALETGRWMFLCGTIDGSNNGKIYKDANLAKIGTVYTPQNVDRNSSFIGKSNWSADGYFDGYLDEVRIYNRALSIEEIQQLYNSFKPETAVLHLKFDGGSGITATDSSAYGNNGELRNFHAPRATGWTSEAVDGNALEFDGVDDYVDIGASYNGVKTVEFWMNAATTTQNIIALNGTSYVHVSDGNVSATGFASPTIYVDGVAASTVDTGWHYVAVTTDTGINASDIYIGKNSGAADATGGTITYSGGYTIHTFISSGTFIPSIAGNVEILVVAGGGGGGGGEANPAGDAPGGGGAGGYRTATLAVSTQAYPVTVGSGGAGATGSSLNGTKGNDSIFSSITATGGGYGGREEGVGGAGGSGGGGGGPCTTGDRAGGAGNTPSTNPVQGYAGGTASDFSCTYRGGAGGGGSSGVGANNLSNGGGGAGGVGTTSSITGTEVAYAGGGGGGTGRNAGSLGGAGQAGGGNGGSSPNGAGGAATANTGSGGGGAGSGTNVGGAGGSGIVIIRYPSYTSNSYFNGFIDDVRVYNRVLSQDEIAADMREGALGKKVLDLKFDEESSSIRDYSSFNNFGGLNGNTRLLLHFDENAGYLAQDDSGFGNIGTIHGNTELLMNFDDNTSKTIKDLSGNANNGTLYGSTRLLMSMDDGTGQTVSDATGYANNGTYKGSGFSFNGTTDYLRRTGTSAFQRANGQELSVEAWIKPSRLAGQYQDIVVNRSVSAYNWMLYQHTTDGSVQLHGSAQYKSTYIPSTTAWTHIVATVTAGGMYKLYANGVVVQTVTGYQYATGSPNELSIGNYGSTEYYLGLIDEVRVYTRALTGTEVKEHYHGTFDNNSSMIGLWHFDEGTGDVVGDDSGQGNNLTRYNATWSTESPAIWQESGAGESNSGGSALAFNGVDDYVNAGNDSSLQIDKEITMEAWVKPSVLSGTQSIISKGGGNCNPYSMYKLQLSGSKIYVQIAHWAGAGGDGYVYYTADGSDLAVDAWVYIVVTVVDGTAGTGETGTMKVYQDGILVDENSWIGSKMRGFEQDLTIGAGMWNCPAPYGIYFNGSIDEVAVHSRALSQAEILDRYNSKKAKFSDWNAGKSGQGLSFNGSSEYVTKASPSNLPSGSSARTIEAWVKYTDTSTGYRAIVDYGTYLTRQRCGFYLDNTSGGNKHLDYITYGDDVLSTGTVPADGNWHHTVATYDGATTVKFYIDNVLDSTKSLTGTSGTVVGSNPINIGKGAAESVYFNGSIDEVAVYSKALSTDEISEQYALGKAKHSDWVAGKNGSALEFDGVDDYFKIPYNSSLKPTSAITMMAWVNVDSVPATWSSVMQYPQTDGSHTSPYFDWAIYINDAGAIHTRIDGEGTGSNGAVPFGEWAHVAITWDGSTTLVKHYINGGLVSTFDGTKTSIVYDNNNPVYIGANAGLGEKFDGKIDELAVYSKALSADQISKIYSDGVARHSDFNAGVSGKAIQFDGVDDFVDVGNGISLNITSDLTVEAWVKPKVVNTWQRFASRGEYNTGWIAGISNTGKADITAQVQGGGVVTMYGLTTLQSDEWYHIVGVIDSATQKISIYLNGQLDNTANDFSGSIADPGISAKIGTSGTGGTYEFNGSIDDVRVYNYAKSAQEIAADYNASKAGYFNALEGWWPLNETAQSTTATDVSGNNNDGTLSGFNWSADSNWASGKYGGGLKFDGTNDYVVVSDNSSLKPNYFTLESWIYIDQNHTGQIINHFKLFNCGVSCYAGYRILTWLTYDGDTNIVFDLGEGDPGYVTISSEISTGEWHHIAAAFDNTNTASLYIDGGLANTVSSTGPSYQAQDLYIGAREGPLESFNGSIDDVRVYSRAKSASEIYADYNAQKHKFHAHIDPMDANLVGLWHLDGFGDGKAAMDSSMQGNHGELVGFDFWDLNSGWVEGKFDRALEFDGNSDYVEVGAPSSLNLDDTFSISVWVKTDLVNVSAGLVSWGEQSAGKRRSLILWNGGSGSNYYAYNSGFGAAANIAGTTNIADGAWHNLVAVTTNGDFAYIYVDGVLQNSGSVAYDSYTYNGANIGRTQNLEYFNGSIDEVAVYNRALTATEVKDHYYAFVNKGGIDSPGAIKQFEGS